MASDEQTLSIICNSGHGYSNSANPNRKQRRDLTIEDTLKREKRHSRERRQHFANSWQRWVEVWVLPALVGTEDVAGGSASTHSIGAEDGEDGEVNEMGTRSLGTEHVAGGAGKVKMIPE